MYTPDCKERWSEVNEEAAHTAVEQLAQLLSSPGEAVPAAVLEGDHGGSELATPLLVRRVWVTALEFAPPGWQLFRFDCDISAITTLVGYGGLGYLFMVVGPDRLADRILLDWTSAPLGRIADNMRLDLASLDTAAIRDYLRFFCSFLGGQAHEETGAVAPFLIPSSAASLTWDEHSQTAHGVARRKWLRVFEPVTGMESLDRPDLPETPQPTPIDRPVEVLQDKLADDADRDGKSLGDTPAAVAQVFEAFPANPPVPTRMASPGTESVVPDQDVPPEGADGLNALCVTFEALVYYDTVLFRCEFEVTCNGRVRMTKDTQLTSPLPLRKWEARWGPHGTRLLCQTDPRESIGAAALLERLQELQAPPEGGQHAVPELTSTGTARVVRGLRVSEPVRWSHVFKTAVTLENVQFDDDVLFDECVFERSLNLIGCRFLKRLSMCDTTVKGALRLDRSIIYGAVAKGDVVPQAGAFPEDAVLKPPPALALRGLKVERSLFADKLTCFGRVRAEWCRIGGTLRARGLQIHPRPGVGEQSEALNISHAQIDGPLDLRSLVPKKQEPGAHRRSFIFDHVVLHGAQLAQFHAHGIRIEGNLDLSACTLKGQIGLHAVAVRGGASPGGWRPRVAGHLLLDRAKTGLVDLAGISVGGSLTFIETQISGGFYGSLWLDYRFTVERGLTGSGANVTSGVYLTGARIGGEIEFVTGRLGRLRISCSDAFADDARAPALRFCRSEASGIVLHDVVIDSTSSFEGLQLHGAALGEAEGGFVAVNVRMGGSLQFWSAELAEVVRRRTRREFPLLDPTVSAAAVREICGRFKGPLDLRGLRVEGSIELGRLDVGGAIRLDGARVEGHLLTYADEARITCESFVADSIRVKGSTDLTGLTVREGGVRARDAEFTGQVLLATPRAMSDEVDAAVASRSILRLAKGTVDLEGSRAARLVLHSASVETPAPQEAAFALARCSFAQLEAQGFGKASRHWEFPRTIDLSAALIGDWAVDPQREALPLLVATAPFDGRNYLDVEQRLAKIGKKGRANRVYRKMLWRSLHLQPGSRILERVANLFARLRNRLNWLFSGNGTWPMLMAVWLVLFLLPVVLVLRNPENVEFVGSEKEKGDMAGHYDLRTDWDYIKATGVTFAYSLPILSGSKFDIVRARLVGPTCEPEWVARLLGRKVSEEPSGPTCRFVLIDGVSPHGFAMMFSTVQFLLWILVFANIPSVSRRRQ